MIDFEKAQNAFERYVSNFDKNDSKVDRKIKHTYYVVEASRYLSEKLNLSKEDAELAELIALLHDIGRFTQSELKFKTYDEAEITFNHAKHGIKVLFEDNLIREFIEDNKYDTIISKAILNHNKLKIEDNLSEKELLHCKLIRDNDKTGNFTFKCKKDFQIDDISIDKKSVISDEVFEEFMNKKTISIKNRKTVLDKWLALIAFVFDYNFKEALEYIYKNNCIDIIFEKISYNENKETLKRIEKMKNLTHVYIEEMLEVK